MVSGQTQDRNFQDPALQNSINDLVHILVSTAINANRYPSGSSIITTALAACMSSIRTVLRQKSSLTIGQRENYLLVDDQILPRKIQMQAHVKTLVSMMVLREFQSFTLNRGLTSEELLEFLKIFGRGPEELQVIDNLPRLLRQKGVRSIEIRDNSSHEPRGMPQPISQGPYAPTPSPFGLYSQPAIPEYTDGQFLSELVDMIFPTGPDFPAGEVEQFKHDIDFENGSRQARLDFDEYGSLIAKGLTSWAGLDKIDEAVKNGNQRQVEFSERISDVKIRQIVSSFLKTASAINVFPDMKTKMRLAGNFLKIVSRLHGVVLASILLKDIEATEDFNLKDEIIRAIDRKQKISIIDYLNRKFLRLLNGLGEDDFRFDENEMKESGQVLKKILDFTRGNEQKELAIKVHLTLGNARLLEMAGGSVESFLALKTKRLLTQQPSFFVGEEFVGHFPLIAKTFIQYDCARHLRRMIGQTAANLGSQDGALRTATFKAFERMGKDFIALGRPEFLGEIANSLVDILGREQEPETVAEILSFLENQIRDLIESDHFGPAVRQLQTLKNLGSVPQNSPQTKELSALAEKIGNDTSIIVKLINLWHGEDDERSHAAAELLALFPKAAVCRHVLHLLKDSDDMRTRKRCTLLAKHFGKDATDFIISELSTDNPWYYNRNLINLLGDFSGPEAVTRIEMFLEDSDERLQKAASSALMKMQTPEALQALLNHFDAYPEWGMIALTQHFGAARFTPALSKLTDTLQKYRDDNSGLACAIIKTLGQIGDPSSAPIVASFLKKSGIKGIFSRTNEDLTHAAIVALGLLADPEYIPGLQAFLHHSNPMIARAAQQSVDNLTQRVP